jgi:hypothetical protein
VVSAFYDDGFYGTLGEVMNGFRAVGVIARQGPTWRSGWQAWREAAHILACDKNHSFGVIHLAEIA